MKLEQIIFELKQQIVAYIRDDERSEYYYNLLLPIIEKFDGKPFGKRFDAALKNNFEYAKQVYCHKSYSWHEVFINIDDHEYRFNLGYIGKISLEEYKRCNTFAQESEHNRCEKNRAFMASGKLEEMATHIQNILRAREFFAEEENGSYDFPAIYSIKKHFDFKLETYYR